MIIIVTVKIIFYAMATTARNNRLLNFLFQILKLFVSHVVRLCSLGDLSDVFVRFTSQVVCLSELGEDLGIEVIETWTLIFLSHILISLIVKFVVCITILASSQNTKSLVYMISNICYIVMSLLPIRLIKIVERAFFNQTNVIIHRIVSFSIKLLSLFCRFRSAVIINTRNSSDVKVYNQPGFRLF